MPAGEGVGTTLASVSGMVHRMAKEGLLSLNKSKQVVLTAQGEILATDVVRRHRLSERLLVNILDVPLDQAETEAHRLEHSISPALLKRIEAKLGHPETCPYGRPIYHADEQTLRPDPPDVIPLSNAVNGQVYAVVRIPDEVHHLLKFLVDNKVLPGQRVRVTEGRSLPWSSRSGARRREGLRWRRSGGANPREARSLACPGRYL